MTEHAAGGVERYLELAKLDAASLKYVGHPCMDDHQMLDEDFEVKGKLSPIAARIVLKCLYLARHNRPDIIWTVNHLSRNVNKWSVADDKRLHRLISFIHWHPNCIQFCFVGDYLCHCYLALFCDASFAGDINDSKSTGGWILFLIGPRTRIPIAWSCKKHGPVSHSSTEAEVVSLDAGTRMDGIPSLMLWELMLATMYQIPANKLPERKIRHNGIYDLLTTVDHVPATLPEPLGNAKLILLAFVGRQRCCH